jgi:AAA15 family ATPase/GTPase
MIVQFSLGNFLSYRDIQIVSFEASNLKDSNESVFINSVNSSTESTRLLKSISIYGSNSSGKSNLLKGFNFFKYWVHNSFNEANRTLEIPIKPYLLREGYEQKNSFFEVIFFVNDVKYRYGCKMTKEAIEEEWLFYAEPKKREQYYFLRLGQEIKYNNNWKKSLTVKIEPIIPYVKPRVLFISVLSQFNIEIGNITVDWFHKNMVAFDLSDEYFINKTASLLQDTEYFIAIHHLIHQAQLGFKSIKSTELGKNIENKKLNKDFLSFALNDELSNYEIQTKHDVYNEKRKITGQVFFDLKSQESAGTQKFFALIGALLTAIKNKHILWIDELDSKFHPLLFQTIIKFFNSNKFNHRGSQMIFTTHSTQLLKEKILRRDQIFTMNKEETGESTIKGVHNLSSRMDISHEKQYFDGKYGGIQKIDLDNLQLDLF